MAIGTTAALIAAGVGAAASIGGAALQSRAAGKAADAQAAAVGQGVNVTRQNFLDAMDLIEPQIRMGDRARNALAYELGIGERPFFSPADLEDPAAPDPALSVVTVPGGIQYETYSDRDNDLQRPIGFDVDKYAVGDQTFLTKEAADNHLAKLLAERDAAKAATPDGFAYKGFEATPGYSFQLAEGQKAIERSAAARGLSLSGATMKANQRYGQGLANQEYGNYLNRLASVAGAGQTATGQAFAGYQNNSNALSQLYGAQGNAAASSYIGQANAWNSGIGNAMGFLGNFMGSA